jgi:hypothetical protein
MVSPMHQRPGGQGPYPGPPPAKTEGSGVLYAAIGCAVFLVVALLVATGVGVWLFVQEAEEAEVIVPASPKPPPPGQPQLAPAPGQPQLPPPPGQPQLPAPPRPAGVPVQIDATVTSVTGAAPVASGATCQFNVEQHAAPNLPQGYWCRAQIVCGGRLLYGGPNSGYFPCTLRRSPASVVGSDTETTASDTDAAMAIDTTQQTLTVRDDAASPNGVYTLEARVDGVR